MQDYRVAERERQRALRERRKQQRQPAADPALSQLSSQATELVDQFLARWDEQARLSRAHLARHLRRLLRELQGGAARSPHTHGALSRASLDAQASRIPAKDE